MPTRLEGTRPAGTSSFDAADAAAHIAALVRRTAERQGRPRPGLEQPEAMPADVQPTQVQPTQVQPTQVQPTAPASPPATPAPGRRRPRRRALVTGGVAAALLALGVVAVSHPFGLGAKAPTTSALGASAPAGYVARVSEVTTDCAAHARGRTKDSFEARNCVKATRSLATGQISGRRALFVVSRIQMPSADAAASVKQVLDGNGTGNLNDLLREGRTFPGAPARMPSSGYASVQAGPVVVVAEAGYLDGPSSNTDAALRAAAAQVAGLVATGG